MATRAEFVRVVQSYVGTPYRKRGRSPGRGLDCPGVGICGLGELGVSVEDEAHYPDLPDGRLTLILSERLIAIGLGELRPGDVAEAFYPRAERPSHIVFIGERRGVMTAIHASAQAREVVEHRLHGRRLPGGGEIVRAFQIPGLD